MSDRCPFATPPSRRTGPWLVCSRHLVRDGRQRGKPYECPRCAEDRSRAARNLGVGLAMAGALELGRAYGYSMGYRDACTFVLRACSTTTTGVP